MPSKKICRNSIAASLKQAAIFSYTLLNMQQPVSFYFIAHRATYSGSTQLFVLLAMTERERESRGRGIGRGTGRGRGRERERGREKEWVKWNTSLTFLISFAYMPFHITKTEPHPKPAVR